MIFSVIIPANNEAGYIGRCLESLLAQQTSQQIPVEIVVAANACQDDTVLVAQSYTARVQARGWSLKIMDIAEGGKPNALNQGDAVAQGSMRLYLDADIVMEPEMLDQLHAVLRCPEAAYASGKLVVAPARSWVTQKFMALWQRLPFMTQSGVTGAGLFAVNAAGRQRWGLFPAIIADDIYVRLQFSPTERHGVSASYLWPAVEGFSALVRVRRRQDAGVHEIAQKYPELLVNEGKPVMRALDHLRLFLETPVSYLVYVSVMLVVRFGDLGKDTGWDRGR